MRIFLALIVLILPVQAWAEETSYFDMQIPVMEGAENIKRERNETFFTNSVEYDLKVKDIDEVYDFYDAFFKEQGWKPAWQGHPLKKNWSGYRSYFSIDKEPKYSTTATFFKENLPVNGGLNVTLTDFDSNNELFEAEIEILLFPNIEFKDHFQFAQNFSDDVKNWFVIGKILGPNPIDLRNTEQPSIPEEYSDHPLILEYKIVKEKLIFPEFKTDDIIVAMNSLSCRQINQVNDLKFIPKFDPNYFWNLLYN